MVRSQYADWCAYRSVRGLRFSHLHCVCKSNIAVFLPCHLTAVLLFYAEFKNVRDFYALVISKKIAI